MSRHSASVLAAVSPTNSEPTKPGRVVTATAVSSSSFTPASRSASSMAGMMRRTCAREAISGTTPPNCWCSSCCELTTLERTVSRRSMTAAAVSSQLDSIAGKQTVGSTRHCPLATVNRPFAVIGVSRRPASRVAEASGSVQPTSGREARSPPGRSPWLFPPASTFGPRHGPRS